MLVLLIIGVILACFRPKSTASLEWNQYCRADSSQPGRAWARKENELVAGAISALSALPKDAQVFIPREIRKLYHLHGPIPVHFINSMCAEYKDNSALLTAKLRLIKSIVRVPEGPTQRYDPKMPVWQQLTADGYRNLILITRKLAEFRLHQHKQADQHSSIILSECEVRFLFKEYLQTYQTILTMEDFLNYEKTFKSFLDSAASKSECTLEEQSSYYAFRGVGYISPRDPESSALRQIGLALSIGCQSSPSNLKGGPASLLCEQFYSQPYATRREIAFQLLRRLIILSRKEREWFNNPSQPLFLLEDLNGDGVGEAIGDFTSIADKKGALGNAVDAYLQSLRKEQSKTLSTGSVDPVLRLSQLLDQIVLHKRIEQAAFISHSRFGESPIFESDQGLSKIFKLDTSVGQEKMRHLLSILISRHAFFYKTFMYFTSFQFLQASTSPFLSSSANFSQAYKFAVRGFAADKIRAPKLGWLYIFKIKAANLFDSQSVQRGESPDFNQDWLDELSLTNHPYALEENGLDRFGEPAPEELQTLLFLGDIQLPSELLVLLETKTVNQVTQFKVEQ